MVLTNCILTVIFMLEGFKTNLPQIYDYNFNTTFYNNFENSIFELLLIVITYICLCKIFFLILVKKNCCKYNFKGVGTKYTSR